VSKMPVDAEVAGHPEAALGFSGGSEVSARLVNRDVCRFGRTGLL
jgi:hypothetical protein